MIPQNATAQRARKPSYVSPATQSLAATLTPTVGAPIVANQNLTPGSPGCVGSAPLVCTVQISLAPGTYTTTFATYDGVLNSSGAPQGNLLSEQQGLPVTIAVAQANTISVTLQGVPTTVLVTPVNGAGAMSGSQSQGYRLSKCFPPNSVTVTGADADGNTIIGPGAPTPSLTSSDTTQLAVTPPSASAPNTFGITRPGLPTPHATIVLTAMLTPGNGGGPAISTNVNVTFDASICGTFTETAVVDGSQPFAISPSGLGSELEFTEATGYLGGIYPTGFSGPYLDFVDYGYLVGLPPDGGYPFGLTLGPDNRSWITLTTANRIFSERASTFFTIPTANSYPGGITTGTDGALWFTERGTNKIGRMTTSGSFTEYVIPTANSVPFWITPGSDGNLWFTENFGNKIGRITTAGTITEYAIPTASSAATEIAPGPDTALWFTEAGANKIGRISLTGTVTEFSTPTANSAPFGIAPGPDGALWFTESNVGKIGRITTNGNFTEYAIPTANSIPYGITTGPDDAIWFAENSANKIGRLQ